MTIASSVRTTDSRHRAANTNPVHPQHPAAQRVLNAAALATQRTIAARQAFQAEQEARFAALREANRIAREALEAQRHERVRTTFDRCFPGAHYPEHPPQRAQDSYRNFIAGGETWHLMAFISELRLTPEQRAQRDAREAAAFQAYMAERTIDGPSGVYVGNTLDNDGNLVQGGFIPYGSNSE